MPLGWVRFNNKDEISFLDLCQNSPRDPLGISNIKQYYANKFFPGVNTDTPKPRIYLYTAISLKELEDEFADDPDAYPDKNELEKRFKEIAKSHIEGYPFNRSAYWTALKFYFFNDKVNKNMRLNGYLNKIRNNISDKKIYEQILDIKGLDLEPRSAVKMSDGLTDDEKSYVKGKIQKACEGSALENLLNTDPGTISELNSLDNADAFTCLGDLGLIPKNDEQDYKTALAFLEFYKVLLTIFNYHFNKNEDEEALKKWKEKYEKKLTYIEAANMKKTADELEAQIEACGSGCIIKKNNFVMKTLGIMQKADTNENVLDELEKTIMDRAIGRNKKNSKKRGEWYGEWGTDYYLGVALSRIVSDLLPTEVNENA